MSHIATIETKFVNENTVKKVCEELGIKTEYLKNYRFYDDTVKTGLAMYLPGWRYPAIICEDGSIFYDNYNGHWGKQEELDNFANYYNFEETKRELRKQGLSYRTIKNEKGEIEIEVQL